MPQKIVFNFPNFIFYFSRNSFVSLPVFHFSQPKGVIWQSIFFFLLRFSAFEGFLFSLSIQLVTYIHVLISNFSNYRIIFTFCCCDLSSRYWYSFLRINTLWVGNIFRKVSKRMSSVWKTVLNFTSIKQYKH